MPTDSLYTQIYDLVRQVPAGKVTTYGYLARIVGCTPRQVGWAMAALPEETVPWHRVINSQGKISTRAGGHGAEIQRALLEKEGVVFTPSGRVNLRKYLYSMAPS